MIRTKRQCGLAALGGLIALLTALPAVAYAEKAAPQGVFITVPDALTGEATRQIRQATDAAVRKFQQAQQGRPEGQAGELIIVYDFNPGNRPSTSTDYGACWDLTKYLLERHGVQTVAFVHNEVTGHAVLPVLACKELVMSREGKLGDVLRGQTQPLIRNQIDFYTDVVHGRRFPAVLVRKMFDPDLVVLKGRRLKDGSTCYFERERVKQARDNLIDLDGDKVEVLMAGGEPVVAVGAGKHTTLLSAEQARQLNLCQSDQIKDRQELALVYGLPPSALREAPLINPSPVAWRIIVDRPLSKATAESVRGMVNQAVRDNATHVILQLEGTGGDWSEAEQLAHFLYNLRNPHTEQPVWTIAYFPARRDKQGALQARAAADTAALVALGCTDIVLGSEVGFGDFSLFVKDADRAQVQQALERLLKQRLCEPLLARGMLDPEATLYLVESIKGRQQRRVVTQEEWEGKLKDEERWRFLRLLVQRGEKRLVLTGQEALDLGVAQHRVEGFEPLCAVYGVDPKRVHNAGTGWLDNLAAFLTQPHVYIILILVGITCLILEFKIPGVTFPGVIAALCFVLFFWSQSHMAGSIGWLAALLFVLGLVLLAVEVFLIPGFGAAGICGILLVVGSLVLGIYNNQRTQSQSWSLEVTLGVFGLGLVGSIVAAIVLASYLPQIPGLNRLILKPQGEEGEATEGHTAPEVVAPQLAALLGAIGVAVTPLRPAGKVQFGEEFIDVVAETGYVNPGARVQVIEIEGNRVVVKEV